MGREFVGRPRSGRGGGLLDSYPNAAAAYSLRLLRSSYAGSAVRVRESGGDTEANIGFTAAGDLDEAALLAHCGANDGFVVTWFDQSGNGNNATQGTAAAQPKIVAAGVVNTEGGQPSLDFDGTDDFLAPASDFDSATGSIFAVGLGGNFGFLMEGEAAGNDFFGANTRGGVGFQNDSVHFWQANSGGVHGTTALSAAVVALVEWSSNGSAYNFAINGAGETEVTFNSGADDGSWYDTNTTGYNTAIGAIRRSSPVYYAGSVAELLVYGADMSASRAGISANINGHYSIY